MYSDKLLVKIGTILGIFLRMILNDWGGNHMINLKLETGNTFTRITILKFGVGLICVPC